MKTELEKLRDERRDIESELIENKRLIQKKVNEKKEKVETISKKIKELEKKTNQLRKKDCPNIQIRVDNIFNDELEEVQDHIFIRDKIKVSKPQLTGLIAKEKTLWPKIKLGLKEYNFLNNKRGQFSFFVVILILFTFLTTIILFTGGVVVSKIDQALDQNISLGQVNLQDINDDTFGVFADTVLNNADWWGLAIIFGMILGLLISAYMVRNRFPKLGIILDIFFIWVAFIIALYISSSYQIILDSLQSAGEPFLETYTPKTSFFILNLPIICPIIGVILMVLFHSTIPKKEDERFQSGGYLQGVQ